MVEKQVRNKDPCQLQGPLFRAVAQSLFHQGEGCHSAAFTIISHKHHLLLSLMASQEGDDFRVTMRIIPYLAQDVNRRHTNGRANPFSQKDELC
jgi:hypothetical protein